jgi:hypothetical protein
VVHACEVHGVADFGARFLPRQWPHGLQGLHSRAVRPDRTHRRVASRGRPRHAGLRSGVGVAARGVTKDMPANVPPFAENVKPLTNRI